MLPAVVGKGVAGDQLGVSRHAGHQLARAVVIDGERLVSAGGGAVDPGPVQHHLDQGPVLTGGPFERLGLFCPTNAVHSDVAILAGGEDVFPGPERKEVKTEIAILDLVSNQPACININNSIGRQMWD